MKLISNVFTIESYAELFQELTGENISRGFWKNLISTYPFFVKNFYINDILPKKKTCITLGTMYFFYFRWLIGDFPEAFEEYLRKKQSILETEDIYLYSHGESCILCKETLAFQGTDDFFKSNRKFNELLEKKIDKVDFIPRRIDGGIIWDIRKQDEDICHLETLFRKSLTTMA